MNSYIATRGGSSECSMYDHTNINNIAMARNYDSYVISYLVTSSVLHNAMYKNLDFCNHIAR